MKKMIMIAALACVAWATDFSHMSTERLMNMRGNVNPNECPAFQQEMQQRMQRMTPQQRQYYMNSGYGMGMGKNSMMKMMSFREFDLNRNGFITPREFKRGQEKCMARMQKMRGYNAQGMGRNYMKPMMSFRDFDINHNGYITKWEFQKGHEKCMARMKKMQNSCGYNGQRMMGTSGNSMMNNNMGGGMNNNDGRMMNNNNGGGMMNNSGSGRSYNNAVTDKNRTMPPK